MMCLSVYMHVLRVSTDWQFCGTSSPQIDNVMVSTILAASNEFRVCDCHRRLTVAHLYLY